MSLISVLTKVIVTAKFWFVSDLEGGASKAEELVSKYHIIVLINLMGKSQNPFEKYIRWVLEMNAALERSLISIEYQKWGSVQRLPRTQEDITSGTTYQGLTV